MSGLRVKELKGQGKTTSKKAIKSGRASGTASPAGSNVVDSVFQAQLRNLSIRSNASTSPPSTPSTEDEEVNPFEEGESTGFDPKKLISELQNRKNKSVTRELLLHEYGIMMRKEYQEDLLDTNVVELLETLVNCANRGSTARERLLSLQAYFVTLMTADKDTSGINMDNDLLKSIIADDDDELCQCHALYALSLTVALASSESGKRSYVEWLLSIIEDNGEGINANGKDAVMFSVFESLALVATYIDFSEIADSALGIFEDKLDSNNPEIQAIAAECMAWVFEDSTMTPGKDPYETFLDPERLFSELENRINQLGEQPRATLSSKTSPSRPAKRDFHKSLESVKTSLHRDVGPFYSEVMDVDGHELQYRYTIKCRSSEEPMVAHVKTWKEYFRIEFIKSGMRSGLSKHLSDENPTLLSILPDLKWHTVIKRDTRVRHNGNARGKRWMSQND